MTYKSEEKQNDQIRTINSFRNIVLEGVSKLKMDKVIGKYKFFYMLHPRTKQPLNILDKELIEENVETLCFDLKEVTHKDLVISRMNKIPYFVLKKDGKLYYTEVPNKVSFISADILGPHVCGQGCAKLSAASDESGGCAKVRNDARYIEGFPWITDGYETFNTRTDVFVVANCLHQLPMEERDLTFFRNLK